MTQRNLKEMMSRHPEGLTAYQLSALTMQSESTVYTQLRKMRKHGLIATDLAWDLPRKPTVYRLK